MDGVVRNTLAERLEDTDYRRAYGAQRVRLELALSLVNVRESCELTQKQLAALAGVSQAYIAKLESGDANPTIGHLGALYATIWQMPRFGFEMLLDKKDRGLSRKTPGPSEYEDEVLNRYSGDAISFRVHLAATANDEPRHRPTSRQTLSAV